MNEPEVIDALVRVWQRDVAPTVRPDCCVLAARVTSLVFDYYGITNKVLAGEVFVFNALAIEQMVAGNGDWREWPEGAWSIGVARRNDGPGYSGHLIVRTGSGTLVDLSAGQFHREGRIAIDGPRVWPDVEQRTNRDGEPVYTWPSDGAWLQFHLGNVPEYRHALDWRTGNKVAGQVIRAINNEREAASK